MTHVARIKGFEGTHANGDRVCGRECDADVEILASGAVILHGIEVEEELGVHSRGNFVVINSMPGGEASIGTPDATTLSGVFADEEICIERGVVSIRCGSRC